MKLAPKSLVVVVLMVLGMAGATDLLVSRLVVRQLLAVEEAETTERARVAAGVLSEQAEEFRLLSQDWAVWSDMVSFAGEPSAEFAEENMTLASFKLKKWRHMAIVRSGDPYFAWSGQRVEPEKIGPASESFLGLAKKLAVPPEQEAPTQGYVRFDGAMFLVASQPLRMSDGRPGATRGTMVYTEEIDETWSKRVRELTRLDLRVIPLSTAPDREEVLHLAALADGDGVVLETRDDSTLATFTLVRDLAGEPLALVEIRHPRPHWAAARDMRRALSIGIAVGAVLLGLLAYVTVHLGLLRPIRALAALVAAIKSRAVEPSASVPGEKRSRDELGRLGEQVRELACTLAEREANLRVAEDLSRAVLDDVDEALVLCDASGEIVSEVSAFALAWFGDGKGKIWSYLGDTEQGFRLELGLEQLTAGFLPPELALAQLPTCFRRGADTFFVRYRPFGAAGTVTGVLLVIEHATERLALAKSEAAATELCNVLRHAIDEPQEFRAFVRESERLLLEVEQARIEPDRMRAIHTLKGNAACFGLSSVAEMAHWLEGRLSDEPGSFAEHGRHLRDAWEAALCRVRTEIDMDDDSLIVPAAEYETVIALLTRAKRESKRPSMTPTGAPCA